MLRAAFSPTPEIARLAGSRSCTLVWFSDNKRAGQDAFSRWRYGYAVARPARKSSGDFARDFVQAIRKNIGLGGNSPFRGWLR